MKELKKTYMNPSMKVVVLKSRQKLLSGSVIDTINRSTEEYDSEFN